MNSAAATLETHFNTLPGQFKPPTVILKRGKDGSMDLWGWHEIPRGGKLRNLTMSATLAGIAAPDHLQITLNESADHNDSADQNKSADRNDSADHEIEIIIKCEAVPPSPPALGSVQGTITANSDSVAPQATIELKVGDAVIGTAKTGDKGAYKIDVPADDYPAVAALLSGPSRDKPLTVAVNIKLIDEMTPSWLPDPRARG